MGFLKAKQTAPVDPLIREMKELDPFSLETAESFLSERGFSFLKREAAPTEKTVEEAVLALGKKRGNTKRIVYSALFSLFSLIYLIDFIRDPSYTLALILAVLAGALGGYFFRQPVRDAKKTAPLYCQNVPSFTLCLFEKGIVFTDGAGNPDAAGMNELFWTETEQLFACLVRERGLVYFEKSGFDESEIEKVRAIIQ